MADTSPKAVRNTAKKATTEVVATVSAAPAPKTASAAAPRMARRSATAAKASPAPAAQPAAALPAAKEAAAGKTKSRFAHVIAHTLPAAKPAKTKKARLVRDSFTMPEAEYAAISALKARCLSSGIAAKKSEILRAAVAALAKLSDADVAAAIQGLAAIKTGRPAKAAK